MFATRQYNHADETSWEAQWFCAATFKSWYAEINYALLHASDSYDEKRESRERERRGKLVAARNSCDLMRFFDYYLMPIAIQPIHTPLTYIGGIRKNRVFSACRAISACADFLPAGQRRDEEVCEIVAIVDLTRIINRTPGCFPRMNRTFISVYYYRRSLRHTRCAYQIANSSWNILKRINTLMIMEEYTNAGIFGVTELRADVVTTILPFCSVHVM